MKLETLNPWQRYGKVVLVKEAPEKVFPSWATKRQVLVKCDCWKEKVVNLAHLKRWAIQSCWCFKTELLRKNWLWNRLWEKTRLQIKIGDKYGDWTVIKAGRLVDYKDGIKRYWVVECSCGVVKEQESSRLNNEKTLHCGCKRFTAAWWMTNTRIYRIWVGMNQRCNNPNNPAYEYYWQKWIIVERDDFMSFHKDMIDEYELHCSVYWKDNTSIDRIDNNWSYNKLNCRRATRTIQAGNRSDNIMYDGRTISEWWRERSIDPSLISKRIKKLWWSYNLIIFILYFSYFLK